MGLQDFVSLVAEPTFSNFQQIILSRDKKILGSGCSRGMEGWEDEIDVDDSDLPSVLRPQLLCSSSSSLALLHCLHPCSQTPSSSQTLDRITSISPSQSQIPTHSSERNQNEEENHLPKLSTFRPVIHGPAGAIQAAMRRKSATAASKRSFLEEEGSSDLDLCVREEDGDFKLNPWLCSLSFLGKGTDSSLPHPISLINAQRCATKRIPQVVGIVKSCTPNGLGDLFITLKDPTGTIGAAIHRKVLSEGNICGEISVGCVFILKQVVALCPAHSSCYLNITLKNVLKLIAKDCGPPLEKQNMAPFIFNYGAEWNGKQLQTELPAAASANTTAKPATRTGEPTRLISKASVAEWTDEQLERLFSDYEDDVDLARPAI